MKRLLLIIPILLMLVSCKFTGGRQQSSDSGVAETILEKVGSALESLEQAEDQARAEADHARYLLRKKYPVAVDLPEGVDLRKAKEGTFLGRPCLIAELYEEEAGGKATTTYYIDKEYGFFYRATQVGTNGNGQEINMTPFEVTYFTDKPTAQNIPNPKASNNPVDALKKQLQGQLDSAQK